MDVAVTEAPLTDNSFNVPSCAALLTGLAARITTRTSGCWAGTRAGHVAVCGCPTCTGDVRGCLGRCIFACIGCRPGVYFVFGRRPWWG